MFDMSLKECVKKILSLLSHDSGWQTCPDGQTSGYTKATLDDLKYRTKSGLCWINIHSNSVSVPSGWVNIGQLPVGARPKYQYHGSICNRDGVCGEIQVQTGGGIYVNMKSTTTWISQTIVFPCASGGGTA